MIFLVFFFVTARHNYVNVISLGNVLFQTEHLVKVSLYFIIILGQWFLDHLTARIPTGFNIFLSSVPRMLIERIKGLLHVS